MKILSLVVIVAICLLSNTTCQREKKPKGNPRLKENVSHHLHIQTKPNNETWAMPDTSTNSHLETTLIHLASQQLQKASNNQTLNKETNEIVDKCYEKPLVRDIDNYATRGLQQTLKVLQIIASNKRGKNDTSLKLPPALLKRFNKQNENSKSHTHQITKRIVRCPRVETLLPCTCDAIASVINCSATGNFTQVKELFNTATFIDRSFTRFLMYNLGHQVPKETLMKTGTFGQATFQEVVIESTNLQAVEEGAFQGSEYTLELIQMEYNPYLQNFPFKDLEKFGELREMKLSYNKINGVTPLQSVPKLETIYLNGNSIEHIDPFAFALLPNLEILDLGKNSLQIVEANQFTFSSVDVVLYLDQNHISNIEDDTFGNKQPILLELSGNQMKTLNASVFQPILDNILQTQYDTYIGAEENPLCCLGIEWILQIPSYSRLVTLPVLDCYSFMGDDKKYYEI